MMGLGKNSWQKSALCNQTNLFFSMRQELYELGSCVLSHPTRLSINVFLLGIRIFLLFKDKRIGRQFGYNPRGTPAVVKDFSYARWAPHFSAISAISSEGLLANELLRNPDERFNTGSFIRFLDQQLLPAMNVFNGENPRSVLVMGENQLRRSCLFCQCLMGTLQGTLVWKLNALLLC